MDKLAQDIQTEDGVANAAIHEAAMRLRELQAEVVRLTIDRDNWKDRAAELHESLADNRSLRARVTEVEVKAERYRLVTLRQDADIARVTAERDEARAGRMELERFRDRYEPVRQSLIKQEAELAALRARNAELVEAVKEARCA